MQHETHLNNNDDDDDDDNNNNNNNNACKISVSLDRRRVFITVMNMLVVIMDRFLTFLLRHHEKSGSVGGEFQRGETCFGRENQISLRTSSRYQVSIVLARAQVAVSSQKDS